MDEKIASAKKRVLFFFPFSEGMIKIKVFPDFKEYEMCYANVMLAIAFLLQCLLANTRAWGNDGGKILEDIFVVAYTAYTAPKFRKTV